MDQLLHRTLQALQAERDKIMHDTFNVPPATLEGFVRAVSRYQGLGRAVDLIKQEDQRDVAASAAGRAA